MLDTYDEYEIAIDLKQHDLNVIKRFADKIRAHMTMYCFGRLDQQYCAMEVIAYIGTLLGEKDYSIDVEKELAMHDAKVRADAIDECIKLIKAHSEKHFVDCDIYEADVSEQENVFIVDDWLNELEQLKEQKNDY